MSYSGDAAEQVVRIGLETGEVAIKLAGAGAKQIAVMLYAILQDQKKTRGKTRLETMLRSGKELKVFAVKDGDLQQFCKAAKEYGVLYCVLKDRDATDGITDIMVRAEDASKINRIFERFKLSSVDMASIRHDIEQSRAERAQAATAEPKIAATPTQTENDIFLDALFRKEQEQEPPRHENPISAGTVYRGQSGHTSNQPKATSEPKHKPSVRKELKKIAQAQEQRSGSTLRRTQTQAHLPPPKAKKKRHAKKSQGR